MDRLHYDFRQVFFLFDSSWMANIHLGRDRYAPLGGGGGGLHIARPITFTSSMIH